MYENMAKCLSKYIKSISENTGKNMQNTSGKFKRKKTKYTEKYNQKI